MNMNIAFLIRFWPYSGGVESVTRVLAKKFASNDHKIFVLYIDKTGEYICANNVIEIHLSNTYSVLPPNRVIGKIHAKTVIEEIHNILRTNNIDIVINQWFPANIVYMAAEHIKIIKCHHTAIKYTPVIKTLKQKVFYGIFRKSGGWLRIYKIYKNDYKLCDKWVFLSESIKRDAEWLYRIKNNNKLCVIPNPIEFDDKENIDFLHRKKQVIYVGRLIPTKRVDYLLDVWKMINKNKRFYEWEFLIIGKGEHEEYLVNKVLSEKIENVIFEGYKEPDIYYKESPIMLCASNSEGFLLTLIEAQRYGCVPITTDSYPSAREILIDDENGYIVEDDRIAAMVEKVTQLMIDKNKWEKMSHKAVENASRYAINNVADMWYKLFDEVGR